MLKRAHRARWLTGQQGVDEDELLQIQQITREIEARAAGVDHRKSGWNRVLAVELADDREPECVVSEQRVPQADDGDARLVQSTRTSARGRPSGSNAWQAQAMHGSNECTVRSTSSGFLGS